MLERSRRHRADQLRDAGAVQGARERRRRPPSRHPGDRRRCRRSPPRSSASAPTTCSRATWSPPSRTWKAGNAPFVYLGSQFFAKNPSPRVAALQDKLKAAYPETELMALETEPNPQPAAEVGLPRPLPLGGRLRHHRHRQAADRHPRRRARPALQGRAEIRLGEERRADQLLHHAEPRAGAASPTPSSRTSRSSSRRTTRCSATPIRCAGLVEGGTFILQSQLCRRSRSGRSCRRRRARPSATRRSTSSSSTASRSPSAHAPTPELETRMMGIAFIGAVCGHVDRIAAGRLAGRDAEEDPPADLQEVRRQGRRGRRRQHGGDPRGPARRRRRSTTTSRNSPRPRRRRPRRQRPQRRDLGGDVPARAGRRPAPASSTATITTTWSPAPFRDGTIAEAPVLPGTGMFMPAGSAAWKDKGLFRRNVPEFNRRSVHRLHGMRAGLPGCRDPEHGA